MSLKGRSRQFADGFAEKEEIAVHRQLCTPMEERKIQGQMGRKGMGVEEKGVAEVAAWVVVVGRSSSCQRNDRNLLTTAGDPPWDGFGSFTLQLESSAPH